jgi:hypothetical protein
MSARQSHRRRCRHGTSTSEVALATAVILFLAVLSPGLTAKAEAPHQSQEAPRLFVDLFSSMQIYPSADAALIGFAMGTVWRPSEKCVHLAGEGFARFGRGTTVSGEQKMRNAGGALGALWGTGDWDRWFGAGGMFDLGWARVGSRNDFALSGYLRALLYWRLRKEFWVGLDVRAGHVIVPVTIEGLGIKGPLAGFGIGAMWGEAGNDSR